MKMCFVGFDRNGLIESCRYSFWKEVEKYVDLTYFSFIQHGRYDPYDFSQNELIRIQNFVNNKDFDVLVFGERLLRQTGNMNLGLKCKNTVLIVDDFHVFTEPWRYSFNFTNDNTEQFKKDNGINIIFSRCYSPIQQLEKQFNHQITFMPWAVDTEMFGKWQEHKYDVVSNGIGGHSHWSVYKFRRFLLLNMPKDINFYYPQYGEFKRESYANFLSSAKIFIFGTGDWREAVAKPYEGMASNCLTMHDGTVADEAYHFKDGFNYVKVNEKNYVEKIKYYLAHEEERQEIVRNAKNTIKTYHNIKDRVPFFLKTIEEKMI